MRINALIIMGGVAAVMTVVVIGLAMFGEVKVQNIPELAPIAPAKNSTTSLDVVIPTSGLIIKNDLIERPMFWKERRPYIPPVKVEKKEVVVDEAPGPDPFEDITLMGIYSGGVMLKVDGAVQRIRIGGTIEGLEWSLDAIGDDNGVVFILGEDYKVLELEHAAVKAPKRAKKVPNKKDKSKKRGKTTAEMMDEIDELAAKKKRTKRKSRAELGKALK